MPNSYCYSSTKENFLVNISEKFLLTSYDLHFWVVLATLVKKNPFLKKEWHFVFQQGKKSGDLCDFRMAILIAGKSEGSLVN